jgi:hypothetical protein
MCFFFSDLMAERVGFVPGERVHINNLRPFSIAEIARNAQNLSIRYKAGTAQCVVETRRRQLLSRSEPNSRPRASYSSSARRATPSDEGAVLTGTPGSDRLAFDSTTTKMDLRGNDDEAGYEALNAMPSSSVNAGQANLAPRPHKFHRWPEVTWFVCEAGYQH